MGIQSDTLVLFNMEALRSKREVVASIEDYILHHQQQDNGEGYSEEKRAVILDICQEFFKKVQDTDIPELTNPFYCYEYSLKHDGMTLDSFTILMSLLMKMVGWTAVPCPPYIHLYK